MAYRKITVSKTGMINASKNYVRGVVRTVNKANDAMIAYETIYRGHGTISFDELSAKTHDNSTEKFLIKAIFNKTIFIRRYLKYIGSLEEYVEKTKPLTDTEKDILWKYYFQKKSLREISKVLNISKSRVGRKKESALEHLFPYLSEEEKRMVD